VVRNPRGALPLKWASLAQKRAELDLNKRCSHLLVYSEHSRGELTRNGFDARQISLFSPIQTDGPAFPESRFSERNLLLFTGQIIRGKGVDYLLRALARVKSRWECAILGEGNHRRACERLCRRLGLADRVRFYGYVAPDRSREFYEEATAMLVPSLWPEPFGMVGPEAMRCGIPVVAFDAGGIREWLRHEENGLLAPWGDIDCFARSIDRLLADKTLARSLGAHGRAWVREQYAADRQVRQLAGLFDRLAVRRGRVSEIFKSEVLCV
jgi:glycosyltransferase involved in cell wall biosynthesis